VYKDKESGVKDLPRNQGAMGDQAEGMSAFRYIEAPTLTGHPFAIHRTKRWWATHSLARC